MAERPTFRSPRGSSAVRSQSFLRLGVLEMEERRLHAELDQLAERRRRIDLRLARLEEERGTLLSRAGIAPGSRDAESDRVTDGAELPLQY